MIDRINNNEKNNENLVEFDFEENEYAYIRKFSNKLKIRAIENQLLILYC